jgi:Winged helix DNA-binding domain
MPGFDLLGRRLDNQRLAGPPLPTPERVVRWLGAVQAQDFAGARWALGLRARDVTDAAVTKAFDEGRLLRTHILRPTWHFVAPADIRWMLALTAPRVHAVNAYYYRKFELSAATFARARRVFEQALRDDRYLTRVDLGLALQRQRIAATGTRLAALVMHAELDGVICSGPRRGKQFTYALLDERVPKANTLTREEALAELTRRYFASHGPATKRDFAWWSGLGSREVKAGVALVKSALEPVVRGDVTYWTAATKGAAAHNTATAHLLPTYDEYLIAYKDRGEVVEASRARSILERGAGEFRQHLVIDGRLAGSWRSLRQPECVTVEVAPYARLSTRESRAVKAAARSYGDFLGLPVTVTESGRNS